MKCVLTNFSSRVARRLVHWLVLALVFVVCAFATPSNISRVEAAPLTTTTIITSGRALQQGGGLVAPVGAVNVRLDLLHYSADPNQSATLCTPSGGCSSTNHFGSDFGFAATSTATLPVSGGQSVSWSASQSGTLIFGGGGCSTPSFCSYAWEDGGDGDFDDLVVRIFFTIVADTTPPTTNHSLAGTLGSNGWYTSNVVVTLTVSDNAGGSGVASTTFDGVNYTVPMTMSAEGSATHTYYSRDIAGNTETTKSISLKIDKTLPTSTITSHASNAILYSTITLAGTTSDAVSGVQKVEVSTNSGITWNTATLIGSSWTYPTFTTALSDGNTTFRVRATDNAGNVQSPISLPVLISNSPPSVSLDLSCPLQGDDGWCKAPVNVVLSGSSLGAPVVSATYSIDDGNETSLGSPRTSFGLTGGTHTAKGYVTNSIGKKSQVLSGSAKVDGAPPTIEFRGADRSAFYFRIADSESGVKTWSLQVFDEQGAQVFRRDSAGEFNGELSWEVPKGQSDSHRIGGLAWMLPQLTTTFLVDIFARDNAGNENAVRRIKFTLNAIATPIPTATRTPTSAPRVAVVIQPSVTPRPSATHLPTATPLPSFTPQATAVAMIVNPPAPPKPITVWRTFAGKVFLDVNSNGVQDDNEPGLGGMEIEIRASVTGDRIATYSGDDGSYVATLPRGAGYVVKLIHPGSRLLTLPESRVVQELGSDVVTDFGLRDSILILSIVVIISVAFTIFVVVQTASLDRRAEAIRRLTNVIESLAQHRQWRVRH